MKEKLTLSINKTTIEKSKKLARMKGVSLSRLVEQYLDESTAELSDWKPKKGSVTERLAGSLPIDSDQDYKTLIEEARLEKYRYGKDPDRQ